MKVASFQLHSSSAVPSGKAVSGGVGMGIGVAYFIDSPLYRLPDTLSIWSQLPVVLRHYDDHLLSRRRGDVTGVGVYGDIVI
jgi:hypothetical protein